MLFPNLLTSTEKTKSKLEMWANAQRDGRPAEYRWCPLLNAVVWLTPTTRVPCSNAPDPDMLDPAGSGSKLDPKALDPAGSGTGSSMITYLNFKFISVAKY